MSKILPKTTPKTKTKISPTPTAPPVPSASPIRSFKWEAGQLLAELRDNNNRTWFMENRDRVEELLLTPGRELVVTVGALLQKKRPCLQAIPRTDHSIYRLNRDVRFSRDKTPYKTHLGLWWWEGDEKRLECPGFYFHLGPDSLARSVGCYRFSEAGLARWRAAIVNEKSGAKFTRLVRELTDQGFVFSTPELKRVPAGFSPDHPRSQWLRHKGFYSWHEEFPHPPEAFSPQATEYLMKHFTCALKLHDWMVKALF